MKKVAKAILIAAGAVLVLGAVVVLGANLYIQSAATQAKIQHALGRALGMPVKITAISFTPWRGLKISGIAAQDVNSAAGENFLEVSAVSARLRLSKLLSREVEIRELVVDSPRVSWMQNPEGQWRFPRKIAAASEQSPESAPPSSEQIPAQISTATPGQPSAGNAAPPAASARKPQVTVDRFRLTDGEFALLDLRRKRIASITGMNIQAVSPEAGTVEGKASVERIFIQEIFALEDWQSDFSYTGGGLSLSNSRATFGGGTATGTLHVKTAEPYSPFDLDVKFSGVDIAQLVSEAHIGGVQATGTLSGFVKLEGNLHDSSAASGGGKVVLANGRIAQLDLFKTIGQLLQIEELVQLDLQRAQLDYRVGGGNAIVDSLVLKTQNLTLTGQGAVALAGGAIFLKTRLEIGPGISRRLPAIVLQNFAQSATAGQVYLDFDITGTLSNPKTNLLKQLGKNIDFKHPANLFKSIFGTKPNPAEPAPALPESTPAAVPNP